MTVTWTEIDGVLVAEAANVQDLVDEITADKDLLHKAGKLVAGAIEVSNQDLSGMNKRDYARGVLLGLQIAQELGLS